MGKRHKTNLTEGYLIRHIIAAAGMATHKTVIDFMKNGKGSELKIGKRSIEKALSNLVKSGIVEKRVKARLALTRDLDKLVYMRSDFYDVDPGRVLELRNLHNLRKYEEEIAPLPEELRVLALHEYEADVAVRDGKSIIREKYLLEEAARMVKEDSEECNNIMYYFFERDVKEAIAALRVYKEMDY